ncbi:phage tail assembly protein T, partial [Flavihumibacter cheonanensis]|uniref:phage tail assembly protein T n=1 Tax=Flavihumibacter cheonanensis TaxID=1442385 RepID=UPI001EF7C523
SRKKLTAADEFWHDLVLNGIGGRTVEEAKERMSYAEAQQWSAYMQRRGSLHVGMRLEWGFALIAAAINNALGGNATQQQFMPHAEQSGGSLGDVMK